MPVKKKAVKRAVKKPIKKIVKKKIVKKKAVKKKATKTAVKKKSTRKRAVKKVIKKKTISEKMLDKANELKQKREKIPLSEFICTLVLQDVSEGQIVDRLNKAYPNTKTDTSRMVAHYIKNVETGKMDKTLSYENEKEKEEAPIRRKRKPTIEECFKGELEKEETPVRRKKPLVRRRSK